MRSTFSKETLGTDILKLRQDQVDVVRQILNEYETKKPTYRMHGKPTSFKRPVDFPKFPGRSGFSKLFYEYRNNAERRGHDFELGYEDVLKLTQKPCYYCGQEPLQVRKGVFGYAQEVFIFNGMDRLDNAKAYTFENTVPCCSRCNYLKCDLPEAFFLNIIREIYEYRVLIGKDNNA